jgi:hypothetical protein
MLGREPSHERKANLAPLSGSGDTCVHSAYMPAAGRLPGCGENAKFPAAADSLLSVHEPLQSNMKWLRHEVMIGMIVG